MPNVQKQMEETYRRLLPELQMWVGWFALIREDRLGGVFHSYPAASRAWMAIYGPLPALIRRIEPIPVPAAASSPAPTVGPADDAVREDVRPTDPASGESDGGSSGLSVICGWAFRRGRSAPQRDKFAA